MQFQHGPEYIRVRFLICLCMRPEILFIRNLTFSGPNHLITFIDQNSGQPRFETGFPAKCIQLLKSMQDRTLHCIRAICIISEELIWQYDTDISASNTSAVNCSLFMLHSFPAPLFASAGCNLQQLRSISIALLRYETADFILHHLDETAAQRLQQFGENFPCIILEIKSLASHFFSTGYKELQDNTGLCSMNSVYGIPIFPSLTECWV